MNYRRIRLLTPLLCRDLVGPYWRITASIYLIGVIVFSVGVGWDGGYPTLFGQRELNLGGTGTAQIGIPLQLAFYESFAWIAALFVFALPAVLLPLANSFSLTHTVWLRGLPCTPREVAAARALRLFGAVMATTLPALAWSCMMGLRHDIPIGLLLTVVLGWVGHTMLSGGIVLVMGPTLTENTQRVVIAMLALMLPVMLAVMCFLWSPLLEKSSVASWFPYACPLTQSLPWSLRHYISAIVFGFLLTVVSVFAAEGRFIDTPDPLANSPAIRNNR